MVNTAPRYKIYRFILPIVNVILLSPLYAFGARHMTADSYSILYNGIQEHLSNFISSYRYVGALVYKLLSFTGHNPIKNPKPDIILFILIVGISSAVLAFIIAEKTEKRNIISLAVIDAGIIICTANVWYCSILLFPECIFLMAAGTLFCFTGVALYCSLKGIYKYIGALPFIILSTGVYQQFITVFTIFIIAVVSAENLNRQRTKFKELALSYLKPAVMITAGAGIYFIAGKIICSEFGLKRNSRIAFSPEGIFEQLKYFALKQHSYLAGRGYFDTEILTVCFFAAGLIWLASLIMEYRKSKNTLRSIFMLITAAGAYVISYILGICSDSHTVRALFGIFAVFFFLSYETVSLTKKKIPAVLALCVLLVLIPVNLTKDVQILNTLKAENRADEEYSDRLNEAAAEYENDTGETVTKLKYCYDAENNLGKNSVFYVQYCVKPIINLGRLKTGRTAFECSKMSDEEKNEIFGNENFTEFDSRTQIIFSSGTAYVCIY